MKRKRRERREKIIVTRLLSNYEEEIASFRAGLKARFLRVHEIRKKRGEEVMEIGKRKRRGKEREKGEGEGKKKKEGGKKRR